MDCAMSSLGHVDIRDRPPRPRRRDRAR